MQGPLIDNLNLDQFSGLGEHPFLVFEVERFLAASVRPQSVVIGLDRQGALPSVDPGAFDIVLTTYPDAPSPWVTIAPNDFDKRLDELQQCIAMTPLAAGILCQTLRIGEKLGFEDAIVLESLAYSSLLAGGEFKRWLHSQDPKDPATGDGDIVLVSRSNDHVEIALNEPSNRNAITAAMRDSLYEALANVLEDPTNPSVTIRGNGKCFSVGGDLSEFGTAKDLAQAHAIRTLRSCARAIDALGDRVKVILHGACIGSGIEIPASASCRIANSNAWFQLPELGMGLMPGAGGTVSMSRAIGRHRTSWMAITGKRINARQALKWGLVHEISQCT